MSTLAKWSSHLRSYAHQQKLTLFQTQAIVQRMVRARQKSAGAISCQERSATERDLILSCFFFHWLVLMCLLLCVPMARWLSRASKRERERERERERKGAGGRGREPKGEVRAGGRGGRRRRGRRREGREGGRGERGGRRRKRARER